MKARRHSELPIPGLLIDPGHSSFLEWAMAKPRLSALLGIEWNTYISFVFKLIFRSWGHN